ncbi:MAG: PepSY domain-containing protein [Acidobacteria bacterium]|nr:PepSY domain-containing protein [Acidobacteriota bacterium]
MKLLRKVIFWCHLPVGIIVGLLILFMAITGSLIAFERQIVDLAESKTRTVIASNSERLSPQALIVKVKEAKPSTKISGLVIQSDPRLAVTVSLGRDGVLFVNPYTGEILGEGAKNLRAFFKTTTELHRWLALEGKNRDTGKIITGISSISFFFLVLSGLFIWLPRGWTRQQVKAITIFKLGLKGHTRNFNWHNSIGFWASSIIFIVSLTGIVMGFEWASNLLYTVTQTERPDRPKPSNQQPNDKASDKTKPENTANKPKPETQQEVPIEVLNNLDAFYLEAQKQAPQNWKVINLRFPTNNKTPMRVFINEGNYWQSSQLSLDQKTAQVISYEPYTKANLGRQLNSLARPVHTGEVLGLSGQIIIFLSAIGTIFLVCTGFLLTYHRFKIWLAKRTKTPISPTS